MMKLVVSLGLVIALPLVASAELLREEPKPGALPEGVHAYVDDGTCPSGQVKQLTGGSRTTKRQRTCVSFETMRAQEAAPAAAPVRWTAVQSLEKGEIVYCDASDLAYRRIEIQNNVLTATSDVGSTFTIRNISKALKSNGSGRLVLTMKNSGKKVFFDIDAGRGPRKTRGELEGCVFLWTPR